MKILKESELQDKKITVTDDNVLIYLKLASIGKNTLEKNNFMTGEIIRGIDGFFLLIPKEKVVEELNNLFTQFNQGIS